MFIAYRNTEIFQYPEIPESIDNCIKDEVRDEFLRPPHKHLRPAIVESTPNTHYRTHSHNTITTAKTALTMLGKQNTVYAICVIRVCRPVDVPSMQWKADYCHRL